MSAIIETLNNAIQAGIAHDWVTMGTMHCECIS